MLEKYALYKALSTLINIPQNYSVRGLARTAKMSASTAKACLDYLFSKKIINRAIIGRTYQYSLSVNFLTKHIRILYSLAEIANSGLVEELTKKHREITAVVLYGSAARGEDNHKSDIDILAVSSKKAIILPLKAEEHIKREVTFLNYTTSEWRAKAKSDKVFYDRIILDGIPLFGEIPAVI